LVVREAHPPPGVACARPVAPDGPPEERTEFEWTEPEEVVLAAPEPEQEPEIAYFGRVLTRAEGEILENAYVEASGRGVIEASIEVERGRFSVHHATPAGLPLLVRASGYSPAFVRTDTVHGDASLAADVRLGPAAQLLVEVRDSVGAPLPGVDVHVLADELALDLMASSDLVGLPFGWRAPRWDGRTNDLGAVRIADLPPAVFLVIVLEQDGEEVLRTGDPIYLEPGERTLTFQIGGGAIVYGSVRLADGAPVPDAEVWRMRAGVDMRLAFNAVHATSTMQRVTTDANGRFELPSVDPGSWWIGLAPHAEYASFAERLELLPDMPSAELQITAHEQLYLRGKVVDPDGAPVEHSRVVAQQEGTLIYLDADVSSEDGAFSLGPGLPGTYVIGAGVPGGDYRSSESIEVEAGDDDIVLQLRRGGVILGRVVDARSGEDVPASIVASRARTGREFEGMSSCPEHQKTFELTSLEFEDYDIVATTADGRVGATRATARPRGEAQEVVVNIDLGGTLAITCEQGNGGTYEVWAGDVFFTMKSLPPSGRREVTVPVGEIWVEWRRRGERERRAHHAQVEAGQTLELVLGG